MSAHLFLVSLLLYGIFGCNNSASEAEFSRNRLDDEPSAGEKILSSDSSDKNWFRMGGRWRHAKLQRKEKVSIYQGHIVIPNSRVFAEKPESDALSLLGVADDDLWPSMTIPYLIDPDADPSLSGFVEDILREIRENSPIRFRAARPGDDRPAFFTDNFINSELLGEAPNPGDSNYADFMEDVAYYEDIACGVAPFGFWQSGTNGIWINYAGNCSNDYRFRSIILHELLHSLGMDHEFARCHAGSHIQLNVENVKDKDREYDWIPDPETCDRDGYEFAGSSRASDFEAFPYDFDSVTHYDAYLFSPSVDPSELFFRVQRELPASALPPRYGHLMGGLRLSRGDKISLATLYKSRGAPQISYIHPVQVDQAESKTIEFLISDSNNPNLSCTDDLVIESTVPLVLQGNDVTVSKVNDASLASGVLKCSATFSSRIPGTTTLRLKVLDNLGESEQSLDYRPASVMEFDVTVGNPSHPPVEIFLSRNEIPGPVLQQAEVARLHAMDCDLGDEHSFAISQEMFTPEGNEEAEVSKRLIVNTGNRIQAAQIIPRGRLEFDLTATDFSGLKLTKRFLITVSGGEGAEHATQTQARPEPQILASEVSAVSPYGGPWEALFEARDLGCVNKVSWNFGDGSHASGTRVRKFWFLPGSYEVEMNAEFLDGTWINRLMNLEVWE